jgi:SpoVK/Ycf46/Vps4 family AAA+-type ATPase
MSKRLYIPLPNSVSRRQLVENVIKKEREKKNKYAVNDSDMHEIVLNSKGYSGSDMINVCREAAMMPIRSVEDIFNLQVENLRDVNKDDFINALSAVKPSVSEKTISQYIDWNKEYGSFQFDTKEIEN